MTPVTIRVRVLAFARLREILGFGAREVELPAGATLSSLWNALVTSAPALEPLRSSTRFARNGEITAAETSLHGGDEVALLPPVGGG